MEYWGNYGGVFLDGKQIGTIKGWMFLEIPTVIAEAETSGMNFYQVKAWQGSCRGYLLNEDPGDRDLEFRFIAKGCYYKAMGNFNGQKLIIGAKVYTKVEFRGTGLPKAIYPPRKGGRNARR